jgi:hypothetical protein
MRFLTGDRLGFELQLVSYRDLALAIRCGLPPFAA